MQTVETACGGYGLSITMVEQVAQMGLACVTHMGLEVPAYIVQTDPWRSEYTCMLHVCSLLQSHILYHM